MSAALPPFPGVIGISHLRVYDWEAVDGLRGGTPHVHTACTEAYAVASGSGAVQTLGPAGFCEVVLEPGSFVWFTPGTIHRLVNHGDLEIFVLMQNAGLPEAGDMVITFPDDYLDDPTRYARAARLPDGEETTAGTGTAARARRDLGIEGFLHLRAAMEHGGVTPLAAFYGRVARLVAPHALRWSDLVREGASRAADATLSQLADLAAGKGPHLAASSVHALAPPGPERRMGCCGTLGRYLSRPEARPSPPEGSRVPGIPGNR